MIEVVLAFLVSGWKENTCVTLPKMTACLQALSTAGEQSPHAASVSSIEAGRYAGKSVGLGWGAQLSKACF